MSDLFTKDAVKMDNEIIPSENNSILMAAVNNKLDADTIRQLVELANKQEDRRAKQDFDIHFSAMQSELPAIIKSKEAKNKDSVMYKYAPLEELQAACNPVISKHGFSYSWKEEAIQGMNGKRTILSIRGYGHVQENYFDSPMIQGTNIMNAIQVAGAMSTYGRRYTFIAGFGLTVSGEDSDAGFIPDSALLDTLTLIETAPDMQMLSAAFADAWMKYKADKNAAGIITEAKDKRKKELV